MRVIKSIIEWTLIIVFFPIVFIAKRISQLFDLWAMNKFWFDEIRKSVVKPTDNGGSDGNDNSGNTKPKAE